MRFGFADSQLGKIWIALLTTMQIFWEQKSDIRDFQDLRDRAVCVAKQSEPELFLRNHNEGFIIKGAVDNTAMFKDFWNGACDAVAYDEPVLEYERMQQQKTCLEAQESCHGRGMIVGESLTFDPYGMVVSQQHPLYENLKAASIKSLTGYNSELMTQLRRQYFGRQDNQVSGREIGLFDDTENPKITFHPWFVVSCLALAGIFAATTTLYWYLYGWKLRAQRAAVDETSQDTHDYNCKSLLCSLNAAYWAFK